MISCEIGGRTFTRSLLDTGASVNILLVWAPPWAGLLIQLVVHSNVARGALRPELVSLGGRAARSGWERDSHLL